MDAPRTSFVLTIAALFAGAALAEPPSQSPPRYSGSNWSSAPTTPPTITATPSNRYAYPQATYPQNTAPAASQPQSISGRTQNAFNETTTTLREGFNTGVRAAGNGISSAAQQTFGTSGYPSQSTNPFTTQPAAPPAGATTRSNSAPPPWPTNPGTPAPPPASSWDSSTPVTPVDRSVLANPSPPPSSSGWSSIGSTIAAPPMLLPQMPAPTNSVAPLNTTSFDNGPSFTTDSYRGQPSFGSGTNTSSQSSPPPSTIRPTAAPANWAATWDGSAENNSASMGRTANNQTRPASTRDSDFPTSPRLGTNLQDTRNTVAKPTDSWTDDSWSRNSQSPQNGVGASIGASKTGGIGSANNYAPTIQPPMNAQPNSPPSIGPIGGTPSFGAPNPNPLQQPLTVNAAKPTQAPTNGEPQSWVTLLAAILGLAGSLAGNVYLGWSYLDARQKYQALVRRTADTFRRTKSVAA
jgi:hypothetical protein